jgi:hypothetical protein
VDMELGQGHWSQPTMRDIHCESVFHAGRAAAEEKKATGMAHASAGDFSRKPGQFTGGDGDSEQPRE